MIILSSPRLERRSANGSFEPDGCCPIPNIPTNVSRRSQIAKVIPIAVLGIASLENFGK